MTRRFFAALFLLSGSAGKDCRAQLDRRIKELEQTIENKTRAFMRKHGIPGSDF